MKSGTATFALLVLLAGCEKMSDVGAMQEEANGIVASYKTRFEDQAKRLRALGQRGQRSALAAATDFPAAQQAATAANTRLSEMTKAVNEAPSRITEAAKAADARQKLIVLVGELRTRMLKGHTEIQRDIDAVESWLTYLELRPAPAAEALPVFPAPEPAPEPTPAPQPEAAPVR